MLDLYEPKDGVSRKVAQIPFDEMLEVFGVGRFFRIQALIGRMVVFVHGDSTVETTLHDGGGRKQQH